MKQLKEYFYFIFHHTSAGVAATAAVLWLLLACSTGYILQKNTSELPCTVSAENDFDTLPSPGYYSLRSSIKTNSFQSLRRQESALPAPFILSTVRKLSCGADKSAKITPVPQIVANPANYVRAGPESDCFL